MSRGSAVKLLIRTAPLTPCGAVTTPRQTRLATAVASAGGGLGGLGRGLRLFLRLLPRLRLFRVVRHRRLRRDAGLAEEARDALARQRADAEPMRDPLGFEGHAIGMRAVEHRVVGAELFDEAAVARAARIRDDDAVIGPLLGAAAREPDLQCHEAASLSGAGRASARRGHAAASPWAQISSSFASCRPCPDIASTN